MKIRREKELTNNTLDKFFISMLLSWLLDVSSAETEEKHIQAEPPNQPA